MSTVLFSIRIPTRSFFPVISITSLHSIAVTQLVLLPKSWSEVLDLEVHKHFNKLLTVVQISDFTETTLPHLEELLFTQSILLLVFTSTKSSRGQLMLSELFYLYYAHHLLDKRYKNILREAILNKTQRALKCTLFIVT